MLMMRGVRKTVDCVRDWRLLAGKDVGIGTRKKELGPLNGSQQTATMRSGSMQGFSWVRAGVSRTARGPHKPLLRHTVTEKGSN